MPLKTRAAFLLLALLLWGAPLAALAQVPVEVAIHGVGGALREAVLANLSLEREAQEGPLALPRVQYLHRRAEEEIRSTLRAFGYYSPRITASLDRSDSTWRADYAIAAGEPVRIAGIDLQITGPGAKARVFQEWRESVPLRPGEVLRHQNYEAAKSAGLRVAEEQGYLEAAFTRSVVEVNTETLQANIILHLTTGPRYRFGPVRFEPIALGEAFLERFVPFDRGEPYRTELVFALQRALINSDYFERVDVIPHVEEAEAREVPVEVRLELRKRNRYSFGLGYGTDTGPRVTTGFDRRWVNQRGHRAGADLTVSGIGASLRGNYRIPLESPTTDFLGFITTWETEETDTTSRETIDVGASLTRSVGKWLRTLGMNYQEEDFEVAGESDRSRLVIPSAGWERVAARTRIFPESGWRLALGVKGAAKTLGSSTSLLQGQLRYKNVFPALGGRVLLRADAGASETEEFDELPASLRFFAGGDQSVRGYAYQSLGPRNAEGEVVGGQFLLVGSIEYDRYVTDRMGWAVFVDTGNAFNNVNDYVLERGVGGGFRWKFPFGVLRLDVASAVTQPGQPLRLHLTIGPEL